MPLVLLPPHHDALHLRRLVLAEGRRAGMNGALPLLELLQEKCPL